VHDIKNILILENHNHAGDILCSLTLFAALKKRYPNSHITFVAARTSYPIPFFELNPYIDEVLVFEKSSLKNVLGFLKRLRKRNYQLGIVPSTKTVSRTLHILNFVSGAKIRAGVKSIDGNTNKSHFLLNLKSDFDWGTRHQLDRNLDIARLIGCDLTTEELKLIKFNFSSEELLFAKNFVKEKFSDSSKKIIGFHPGAGKIANTWDADKFIELISKIHKECGNQILITKGLVDDAVVDKVSKSLDEEGIKHVILQEQKIKKLGAVLSLINLYITNDTGTMHIGGYSGAKIISLFGPTNPKEWAPRGENQFFIKSESDNINDISIKDVFDFAKKMLGN
jgi:ADP-heptose:LPS heptosyltransferase